MFKPEGIGVHRVKLATALALLLAPISQLQASERIELTVREPWSESVSDERIFSAKCRDTTYEVRVRPTELKASLVVRGKDSAEYDLGITPFGKALLDAGVLGSPRFTCGKSWVNVYIQGIALRKKAQPEGLFVGIQYLEGQPLRWGDAVRHPFESVNRQILDY